MRILDYVFSNVDEAINYIAEYEKLVLGQERPKNPPPVIRDIENMFNQPFDERIMREAIVPYNSIDYSYASFYNGASDDEFIINRLFSGRYSLNQTFISEPFYLEARMNSIPHLIQVSFEQIKKHIWRI